ncbi:MAG: formimidoylglutamase [Spirochaetes bacterium]|nr:formimidoylglutamase [Spirochaetota bacterium]MBU1079993.1 formimidoylglutamase [Spirochaetota bacterium]
MYRAGSRASWSGRIDSIDDFEAFRWHQWIEPVDLEREETASPDGRAKGTPLRGVAIIGFRCDEGVKRNQGRAGARLGPAAIRAEAANLPCSFDRSLALYDTGDVDCEGTDLEAAQALLGRKVEAIRERGWFPVVLGGGHETAYGHWLGQRARPGNLGIINFDAHLDMRPYPQGGSSGSMFRQIADASEAEGRPFRYLCVGAQKRSNTVALFRDAAASGASWLLARDINEGGSASAYPAIDAFLASADSHMITVCADVVSSAWAPGVSAPQPLGLDPETLLRMLKRSLSSGKAVGLDICEVSPRADGPDPTASLAATLLFAAVNSVAELAGLGR